MRRRILSDQELEEVIKRKQSGASWLKIQNETGIPRRTAKRAYEDWERSRSLEDMSQVRRDVAMVEFRQHLHHLRKLADSLVDYLSVPDLPITESSHEVLSRLWQRNIIGEPNAERGWAGGAERATRRIVRQNRLLFEALRDHTRGEIRWEALNEWERAWDNSIHCLNELRKEAHEMVGNILDQQRDLRARIQEESVERDAVDRMAEAVLRAIWLAIQEDNLNQECLLVPTKLDGDGRSLVTYFRYPYVRAWLEFADTSLVQYVVDVGNWAIDNLRKGDKSNLVRSLEKEVARMQKATEELEEMLDPLRLRPIILRTRCDLCPA